MIPGEVATFFGGDRHLAGWYTAPAPGADNRDCAVLFCQPIGHEYMCSHRAFRVLARDLAALGFPVFRFDYYGTGDSAGPSSDESLVPEWVANVSIAADELHRRSGYERIAIVGLRFGATLAATASIGRDDIDSLVLWSPCTNGRSLMRQSRMLAMTAAERPDDLVHESAGLESAGFFLDAATVADVSRMSMDQDVTYSSKSALIMTSADGPAKQRLLDRLTNDGVACEEKFYDNHARFMVSPLHSSLPTGAIDTIAQWLVDKYPATDTADTADIELTVDATGGLLANGTRESAVSFADGRLNGILIEPAQHLEQPAVLLLNTGADHHVGPHRMYVPLARQWADLGFPVLRFDLAGLGDSTTKGSLLANESYPATALQDIRDAMAYMRSEKHYSQLVLAGICSGAYHAIHGADPDVTAVISVNPPLYYRPGDPVEGDPYSNEVESRRVTRALRNPAKWRRLLSGNVDLGYTFNVLASRARIGVRAIGAGMKRLVARDGVEQQDPTTLFHNGVATHLIFSGGDASQLFFERAIAPRIARFRHHEDFTVDIVPGADHTFMPIKWQRALAELMTKRLLEHSAPTTADSVEKLAS